MAVTRGELGKAQRLLNCNYKCSYVCSTKCPTGNQFCVEAGHISTLLDYCNALYVRPSLKSIRSFKWNKCNRKTMDY